METWLYGVNFAAEPEVWLSSGIALVGRFGLGVYGYDADGKFVSFASLTTDPPFAARVSDDEFGVGFRGQLGVGLKFRLSSTTNLEAFSEADYFSDVGTAHIADNQLSSGDVSRVDTDDLWELRSGLRLNIGFGPGYPGYRGAAKAHVRRLFEPFHKLSISSSFVFARTKRSLLSVNTTPRGACDEDPKPYEAQCVGARRLARPCDLRRRGPRRDDDPQRFLRSDARALPGVQRGLRQALEGEGRRGRGDQAVARRLGQAGARRDRRARGRRRDAGARRRRRSARQERRPDPGRLAEAAAATTPRPTPRPSSSSCARAIPRASTTGPISARTASRSSRRTRRPRAARAGTTSRPGATR